MKKFTYCFLITSLTGFIFLPACNNDGGDVIIKKTGVIVVNQGNFGSGNGTISFYDEDSKTITNDIIAEANAGATLGSIIESVQQHEGEGYIICNAADKIEFISLDDFKFVANPVTNITSPRYMAIHEDRGYITCYGPWDANWSLSESYVAVLDLDTRTIIDSLDCGSGPEGIILHNKKLYVANSYEKSVSVIDIGSGASSLIQLDAAPQHFALDENKDLWVTVTSYYGAFPAEKVGLQQINTSSNTKGNFVQVPDLSDDGLLVSNGDGSIFFVLSAALYPSTTTNVMEFVTKSRTLVSEPLIEGNNYYGLGYNTTTDKIYVGDAAGFAGNGNILVYKDGVLQDDQVTSIGPFHFMFK